MVLKRAAAQQALLANQTLAAQEAGRQTTNTNSNINSINSISNNMTVHERKRPYTALDRTSLNRMDEVFDPDTEEGALYWKFVAMERQLEAKILKKQLAIADASFRIRKISRCLRLELTVSSSNNNNVDFQENDKVTEFTVCLKGRLEELDGQPVTHSGHRLTTLLHSAILVLRYKKDTENEQKEDKIEGDEPFFREEYEEWMKRSSVSEQSISWTKSGPLPLAIQVILRLDPQLPQFKLHPGLAELTGCPLATRSQVIMSLWQYIKLQRLQESEDKKAVKLDDKLGSLFRGRPVGSTIVFSDLPVLIQPLLFPLDPVVLDLDLSKSLVMESSVQMTLEERASFSAHSSASFAQTLSSHLSATTAAASGNKHLVGPAFAPLIDIAAKLMEVERVHLELAESLLSTQQTCKWLKEFTKDPHGAVMKFSQQITKDYDVLVGNCQSYRLDQVYDPQTYAQKRSQVKAFLESTTIPTNKQEH